MNNHKSWHIPRASLSSASNSGQSSTDSLRNFDRRQSDVIRNPRKPRQTLKMDHRPFNHPIRHQHRRFKRQGLETNLITKRIWKNFIEVRSHCKDHRRMASTAECQRFRSSFDRIIDSFHGCQWIWTFKRQAEVKFNLPTGPSDHHSHCYNERSIHYRHHRCNLFDGQ